MLPPVAPEPQKSNWIELFHYPRSIIAGFLTGLSQTGAVGLGLWQVTLIVLVLNVTPAQASFMVIWITLIGIGGRIFGASLTDKIGRRPAGILCCVLAAATMSLCGYLHAVYLGPVPMFYVLLLTAAVFYNSTSAICYPYMAEMWPAKLRASGFGLSTAWRTWASSSARPGSR